MREEGQDVYVCTVEVPLGALYKTEGTTGYEAGVEPPLSPPPAPLASPPPGHHSRQHSSAAPAIHSQPASHPTNQVRPGEPASST